MFTVKDALNHFPISLGKVLAGRKGLSKEIKTTTVLEIPDASEFLEKKLACLTSFYAIAENIEKQIKVIELLSYHQVSALFLFNVGRINGIPDVSPKVINTCNEHDLPLIQMPLDISYNSVLKTIMNQILNRHDLTEAYMTFIDELLDANNSYTALMSSLGNLLEKHILYFNHQHRFSYSTESQREPPFNEDIIKSLIKSLPKDTSAMLTSYYSRTCNKSYLVVPIERYLSYYGSMIIWDIEDTLPDIARFAINQAHKALPMSIMSSDKIDEYQSHIQNSFLQELLLDSTGDKHNILTQAKNLSLNIENCSGLLIILPYNEINISTSDLKRQLQQIYLNTAKKNNDGYTVMLDKKKCVAVICTSTKDAEMHLAILGRDIHKSLDKYNIKTSIGISPEFNDITHASHHFYKTLNNIFISNRIYKTSRIMHSEAMSVYSLIYDNLPEKEVRKVVRAYLKPIRDYDKSYNTQLEKTFYSLIKNDFSTSRTADQLFVHNNTVLQRKNRIMGICNTDPFKDEARLTFNIIFLLRDLFNV